jgi:UDP-glucose/GDP-mannose dehydrogenase family protein
VLTIFASPKPFHGHTGVIQRNAIASWTLLQPRPEIILFGDDPGVGEICREHGLRHIPQLASTEFGAPLLSDLFDKAQFAASQNLLCYINADIMLTGDFLEALHKVSEAHIRFLMVGRRWDVSIQDAWDFTARGGANGLREFVRQHGKQGPPPGNSDFFAFSRGLWRTIPPLGLGRAAWDAWLIYEARRLGASVVDASSAFMAIHQTHDQSTYTNGLRRWRRELNRNWEIAGKEAGRFCLWDATHTLTPEGLTRARGARYFIRRVDTFSVLHPKFAAPMSIVRLAAASVRYFRRQRDLARDPLLRLINLIQSKLPPEGITAILGLSGGVGANGNEDRIGFRLANSLTWIGLPVVVYDPDCSSMEHARRSLGGPVKFAGSVEECVSDADVIVIASPHPEFRGIPVETLVRQGPARPVIDCCELRKGHAAREFLGYAAWSEK